MSEIIPDISLKVRKLRGDISQIDFAESIDCSRDIVSGLELGKYKTLELGLLKRICRKYKVSYSYFLEDFISVEQANLIWKSERIVKLLSRFSDEVREEFKKQLKNQYLAQLYLNNRANSKERELELEEILDENI